ncbi:hypothetical protein QJS10_CPB20g00033 [Acorus calamus]|uniref:Late embryogenesis abundant protein LEA-2 subgroup domain-containing protein n=1 Tax=Acorus calamus TaxID=4465 RepID=A0AAV9CAU0_ACOCL|nr:hypothetical protein QJS10_CPB20g00033 [Acorus calamus]
MDSETKRPIKAHNNKKKKLCLCLSISIFLIFLLFLILGLTLLKPHQAITTVKSVTLGGLRVGLDVPRLTVDLNVTLHLVVSVENPNRAGFRYGEGSAEMYYRGVVVGVADIPAGEIGPMKTAETRVDVTVFADRLVSDSKVYSDVLAGEVPLKTSTRIAGKGT